MPDSRSAQPTRRIAIIGSGFSGIGLGIQLARAGIDSFTMFEKSDRVGGTWRDNTYPGAECDSPAFAYCFSFEQKTDWSAKWVPHDEIQAYMEHCVDKYHLRSHIRFDTEIVAARFDARLAVWHVSTSTGEELVFDFLVSGVGQLHHPSYPEIPGLETFEHDMFHSARWRHDVDLEHKTVGVIGSAASAIQLIPHVAREAGRLFVFQRSPNWTVPRGNRPYTAGEKRRFADHPWLARLYRWWIWAQFELRFYPVIRQLGFWSRYLERMCEKHMRSVVKDPALQDVLVPDYPVGGKRVLIADDYYPALNRDNVEVVSEGIERVTADSVITSDGTEHPVDVLVLATGFETTDFLAPMKIRGLHGRILADEWAGGAQAYLGLTVSDYPNFFMMYGPNTNLGHNSILFMIECQVNYIVECIRQVREFDLAYIDLRRDVLDAYNEHLQRELQRTVWSRTGKSWYKNDEGTITNNWSNSTVRYWWMTRRPNLDLFVRQPRTVEEPLDAVSAVAPAALA